MSFGVDTSKNPQTASTDTTVTTTRISDAYNKTFSYVYSPSTSTTSTTGGGFDSKTLIVAGIAGLLVLLGIVAARN
jgi:hypothetical protein